MLVEGDEPWQAVSEYSDVHGPMRIYLNVCGSVKKTGGAANCPVGAAVCVKGNCSCAF